MKRPALSHAAPMLGFALLSCGPTARPASVSRPPDRGVAAAGLDRVMGHDAAALTTLFGTAALDVREGTARKLQYRSAVCILDAYLYPSAGGPARVTWIDARTLAGVELDRASCIAALARVDQRDPHRGTPPASSQGRPSRARVRH